MKRINLKWVIITLLLFFMFPTSVSAGILDGGSTGDGVEKTEDKEIIDNDLDHESVNNRLSEYTSFVSDGNFGGNGAYSALGDVDEDSINGYAVMIDTETGGRGGVRDGVECVENYQGYYYYDIKLTVPGESNWGRNGYSRRTYYKYVQLKKEDRTFNGSSTLIFDGASTGIWLYYSSDQVADQTRQIQTELGLIDVFTGESMSSETKPYWEEMFMWPLSSKGIGVASDTGDIVSAICNHDPTSYESISKDNAFCLAFFQRRNTRRSPAYMTYNTKYGCTYDVAVPSYSTLIAKIVAVTGHNAYYNYPQGAWYYQTSGQAGLKNWVVTNGVMTRMDTRYTYSDHNGKTWPTYFLYNSTDGLRYNTSTGYSYMLEEIGGQSELLHGIDSDIFGSHPFKNYTTHRNPNTHTFITNGFVNASWVNATNDGSNLDNAPREILRTLQVFLKSHEGAFNKFIGYVNKEASSYNHNCYYGLCNSSNLSMTNFNIAVATGNSQLALDMLTTLYEAGRKYSEWYDYASDGLATKIGVAHGGWYNHYSSGILAGEPQPTADTILMGDGNKLQIVDLFKAFGVSDSKAYDFIERYRENPYDKNLSIPGLNSEKTKMIINALNGKAHEVSAI